MLSEIGPRAHPPQPPLSLRMRRAHEGTDCNSAACVLIALLAGCGPRSVRLSEFSVSPFFDEQVLTFAVEPDITVHVNAPSAAGFDASKPTLLALYALPNGNTIPQTIGCAEAAGLDWHYYIQHIGAQTRRLREVRTDANLVVAYLEAGGRSWPAWRKDRADAGERIVALVGSLRARFPGRHTRVALTGHSGGGSFIFGYLQAADRIPDWIERIVWLDANYGYDRAAHLDKLLTWLIRDQRHALAVVAYDDRQIELNGKKIIGPTGGAYRRSHEMAKDLGERIPLTRADLSDRERWSGLGGRIDVQVFKNPENHILHTVLVEKNGFIHALGFEEEAGGPAGRLWEPRDYEGWIQPEPQPLSTTP